jgi:hypothetical protein
MTMMSPFVSGRYTAIQRKTASKSGELLRYSTSRIQVSQIAKDDDPGRLSEQKVSFWGEMWRRGGSTVSIL